MQNGLVPEIPLVMFVQELIAQLEANTPEEWVERYAAVMPMRAAAAREAAETQEEARRAAEAARAQAQAEAEEAARQAEEVARAQAQAEAEAEAGEAGRGRRGQRQRKNNPGSGQTKAKARQRAKHQPTMNRMNCDFRVRS